MCPEQPPVVALVATSTARYWLSMVPFTALRGELLLHWQLPCRCCVAFFPSEGRWFTIHFLLNLASSFYTIVAFAVAVSAAEKASTEEDPNHSTGRIHRTVGLIIFFGLTFFQVIGGLLRPHLPEPHSSVILAVRHFGSILPSLE